MGERGRVEVYVLAECIAKSEVKKVWRKGGEWVVKSVPKGQMCERMGEEIDWLVEIFSKCEMCDIWWQIIHQMVKEKSKCDVSDGGRKVIRNFIKFLAKFNFFGVRREGLNVRNNYI